MHKPINTLLLAVCFLASSCAIYLDEPYDEEFTGQVKYKDGRPAKNTLVTVTSYRDYFPLLLMLAPHQPLAFYANSLTDNTGFYSIKSKVSKPPRVFATVRSDDPKVFTPKFIGSTKEVTNAKIILKPYELNTLNGDN